MNHATERNELGKFHAWLGIFAIAAGIFVSGAAGAQSYHVDLGGAPQSISCTESSITVGPGVTISGHLASLRANAFVTEYLGDDERDAYPVAAYPVTVGPTGVRTIGGVTRNFQPRSFPYTYRIVYQPVPSGDSAELSFSCPSPGPAQDFRILGGSITPAAGMWWNPDEPGSGYALDYKHEVLVVAVYAYAESGEPTWYIASGPVVSNVMTGELYRYRGGQCLSCAYAKPAADGDHGAITVTFVSASGARVSLPGGREISIRPLDF